MVRIEFRARRGGNFELWSYGNAPIWFIHFHLTDSTIDGLMDKFNVELRKIDERLR